MVEDKEEEEEDEVPAKAARGEPKVEGSGVAESDELRKRGEE